MMQQFLVYKYKQLKKKLPTFKFKNNLYLAEQSNMVARHSPITCDESHLHFLNGESRFYSTSQVILSIGAVPYPMELPPT